MHPNLVNAKILNEKKNEKVSFRESDHVAVNHSFKHTPRLMHICRHTQTVTARII
jgi:hypothetical protein